MQVGTYPTRNFAQYVTTEVRSIERIERTHLTICPTAHAIAIRTFHLRSQKVTQIRRKFEKFTAK